MPVILAIIVVYLVYIYVVHKKGKGGKENDIVSNIHRSENLINDQSSQYSAKGSIMTECERSYFEAIREIVEPKYTVQPQINLASVIDKKTHSQYRNELFRNIDFGVFDKQFRLLVLIEINDQSHTKSDRKERDNKVKAICSEANIPLITFWTNYGVNRQYIKQRLSEYLILPVDSMPPEQQ